MYYTIMQQMKKGLGQMSGWFDKAIEHAEVKKFDPNILATMRLAPNQFEMRRQVQTVCDTAKLATARLTGKEAPKHDDTELTLVELKARIASVLAWLDGITEDDFANAADKVITNSRWVGKHMLGPEYFVQHALPNFYFHLTMTYAILRHAGVDVGKRDFLGQLSMRED